jgi:hypothetical protein
MVPSYEEASEGRVGRVFATLGPGKASDRGTGYISFKVWEWLALPTKSPSLGKV